MLARLHAALAAPGLGEALSGYRNVLAIVAALTVLQCAMAALSVLVALALKAGGAADVAVGMVASSFAAGFLLGALRSPRAIARIGHIRAYALFAAIAAIAALAFALNSAALAWAAVQLVLGYCCAGLLAAGESWIAEAAPAHRRGAILGFYHLLSKSGAFAGPFIVAATAYGAAGYMAVAALFAASLLPVAATSKLQPELASAAPYGPRTIYRNAPAAAIAAFAAGAVNNAVAQLYPVFAAGARPEDAAVLAAQFNAALLAGAMAALWPAGLASDRFDRRIVIGWLAALGAIAAAGLAWAAATPTRTLLLALAALFGAGSLSYYGVAVAHAADRARPEQTTSMMAGILMIWGLGSVIGPALAGAVMSMSFGRAGLFVFAGAALALLSATVFARAARTEPVPAEEKAPFKPAPATSFAIAEIDPRGDADQLDLFKDAPTEALP